MANDETREPAAEDGQAGGKHGGRLGRGMSHRSRSAYVVLAVGVIALLSLLLIIYFSSDRNPPELPICTTVSAESARQAVLEGRISRITLAYDDMVTPPSAPDWGPVLARLDYTDGQCANLPQGIMNQNDIYTLLGAITVFNDITENAQVEIKYDRQTELSPSLFATPAPSPTPTLEPTATSEPTSTPEPTATTVPSPASSPEMIGPVLLPGGTPIASPEGTPSVR
ncbi:MAG TPA: hypothetical protein VNZ58_03300 [Thermomicrobiales bacterium]|nr:hypothetical protein [Thermomicrobiales bacterium]